MLETIMIEFVENFFGNGEEHILKVLFMRILRNAENYFSIRK